MRSRLPILLALGVATSAAVFAQTPAPAISLETLKSVTQELSSDAYEGRAPATPAEDKTVAYIVKRFQAAGLKPGNNGQWVQDVPMVEMTVRNPTALTFTGGKSPVQLAYRTDAVFGSYQVVPRTEVKNSDVVFVGYGINAPEKGWNDYAGVDAKGKTVVILVNDPDWQATDLKGDFGGRAMTYYGRWTYKFEEAARQGAAAAIIIHDTEPAAYGFGVVQSSWTGPQLQLDATNNHMDQSKVIGWITNPGARSLFASAGKDYEALVSAAKLKGFKAVPLGVKASVAFDSSVRRQASKNVAGILPGQTAPDEYVLYSAHWDHLGRCDAVAGDDICNGALDNATGVAALVALAETNTKTGPARRSQVFLAVTGEESGLLGSEYYAVNPVYPLSKTVGGVNMDGLNVIGQVRDFEMTGAGKSEIEDLARPLFQAQGRVETPEATPEKGHYYRSDHFSFAKLGVPMLAAGSGQDRVVGGKAAGKAAADDYVVNRYHRPDDEYDPKWDWSGALQDLQVYYTLGRQLADGSAWPNWYPTAEFRAARDKSRAQADPSK